MKKSTIFATVFFILACVKLYSQSYGWFSQSSGTSNNLNGVYFASSTTGIIVGQSGTILRTTNGGTNWNAVTSGTSVHLFAVYFVNGNTGWVVGDVGVILKTTNGGVSWSSQTSNVGYQLRSVGFINTTTGYVAGWYGTFLRTTNGGSSWVSYSTGLTSNLTCINFADASIGFAGGQFGKLIRTTNGGVNWAEISSGITSQIEQVNFTASNEAVIVGEGGFIRKTTNLGTNWVTQTSGTGNWLSGMSVKNQNFYVIVGDYGTVRKTSNGGANWYSQTSSTSGLLTAVSFVDTNTGWAVGINGKIIKTTTGGWLLPGAASLSAPGNGATCFSLTGLLDWSDVFPPVCNYRVQISTNSGFTAIVHELAGINVSQYNIPANTLNYNTLYYWRVKATNFVGESTSWSSVRNFRTVNQSVSAPVLLLPLNNSAVNSTPQLSWDSIPFSSGYHCIIASDTGFTNTVFDSSNIASMEINVPAGVLQSNTRYYWKVNSSNSCITSPYSGTWSFITSITGLSQTGNEVPAVYSLYNNYPNPFNPTTNIRFDIPKGSIVKLTIYNLLGEEVSVLVNSQLDAGKYSYSWNAQNYSSGLYMYRLEALSINETGLTSERFVKTYKMVLVK